MTKPTTPRTTPTKNAARRILVTRLTTTTALVATAALGLSGCETAKEAQAAADAKNAKGPISCPVTPDTSITTHVKVAYQYIPNADLVVKNRRLLETCMPKAHIEWAKFDAGSDVVQAFGSGSADIGLMGSSPATKALSAPLNIPMKVVWIHDVIGQAESLVARDASVTKLADLKGKKIGVPFGSTSHYSLVLALQQAGMSTSDVQLVNLSPDKVLSAWKRGDIDAAWVWDPTLGQIKTSGHVVMSSADTAKAGSPTYDLGGARTAFIDKNPAFMTMWTKVEDYAVKQVNSHPSEAAESIAVELGIEPKAVEIQLKGYRYLPAAEQAKAPYFGGGLAKTLHSTATFLQGQGDIGSASPESTYAAGVYATAIKETSK